jgi:hypothetical protein
MQHVLMLWDPSFDSWSQLGIAAQPQGILYGQDGQVLKRFTGRIPEAEILELLG